MLNDHFSPEIHWEAHEYEYCGMVFGLLYVHEAHAKPVVCLKRCDPAKCKEGEIYYRYRGRSEAIKYPELCKLLDEVRAQERDLFLKHLRKIARIGVTNAAIMDSVTGEVTGSSGSFLIDESLLPKIAFIKEGHFTESKAAPALKLIGDVETIDSHLIQPTRQVVKRTKGINSPEIVNVFLDQEDVPDAAEYISAICYQTASTWPVYYFMGKAGMTTEDVIALIDKSKSTSQAKPRLRKRMESQPSTSPSLKSYNSKVAACRNKLLTHSLDGELNADGLYNALTAVLTLSAEEIDKDYLFPRLKTWFEESYSEMGNKRERFRSALVYLDALTYAPQVVKCSKTGGADESD